MTGTDTGCNEDRRRRRADQALAAAVAVARAGLETVHLVPRGRPTGALSALMRPSVDYLTSGRASPPDPAAIGQPLTQIRIIDRARGALIRAPETLFDSAEFRPPPRSAGTSPNVKLAESLPGPARSGLANLSTIETTRSPTSTLNVASRRLC